jgi:hypothetical protein
MCQLRSKKGDKLPIRTPLCFDSAAVWADPESGTVRFGTRGRNRVLFAGLHPTSYVIGAFPDALVAAIETNYVLSFRLNGGVPADIKKVEKPGWCEVIESILPSPLCLAPGWLEVGIEGDGSTWRCSIPIGGLPKFHSGLTAQGLHLKYITRTQAAEHAAD